MQNFYAALEKNLPTPVQQIDEPEFAEQGVQLFLKRDDVIHPEISGNKWRKLKYNLLEAQRQGCDTVVTFGGAYSNHIAATAAACRLAGIKSVGIIRGEELNVSGNATLKKAAGDGMLLKFISRDDYRRKEAEDFLTELQLQYDKCFMIPEGGANAYGLQGCAEILKEVKEPFDVVCVACGTGTTMAGILTTASHNHQVIGFSALKGGAFLAEEARALLRKANKQAVAPCRVITDYHFGGYARHTAELIQFIYDFKTKYNIELDFAYTGKMLFGIYDLIQKGFFHSGTKILAIHTGGTQGNSSIGHYSPDVFQIP